MTTQELINAYYSQTPVGIQGNIYISDMSVGNAFTDDKDAIYRVGNTTYMTRIVDNIRKITFTLRRYDCS